MKRTQLMLAALVLSGLTFLAVAKPAEAAPPVRLASTPAAYRPVVQPGVHHMPGWDWQRTYPWSAYNYGRNPYNPVVIPAPGYLPYVYPMYVPRTAYYPNYYYYGTPTYPLGNVLGQ